MQDFPVILISFIKRRFRRMIDIPHRLIGKTDHDAKEKANHDQGQRSKRRRHGVHRNPDVSHLTSFRSSPTTHPRQPGLRGLPNPYNITAPSDSGYSMAIASLTN